MIQVSGVIICLSYILGLLFTAVPGTGLWVLGLGVVAAIIFKIRSLQLRKRAHLKKNFVTNTKTTPQALQLNHAPMVWLIAGVVGLLASVYFQSRIPHPGINDISKFVPSDNDNRQEQLFIVRGQITSTPHLTRTQKGQFWLAATQLDEVRNDNGRAGVSKGVTGKLYVTVPLLQATGLHPGQQIAVTGVLYKPQPASNPGAFDFQQFLKQEGSFAGLSGRQLSILDEEEHKWGLWQVREQIIQSQVNKLGVPEGTVVSAMTLGTKVVDLPFNTRDSFVRVGLAHALAGPGLKTSLILAVVLTLTRRSTRVTQFTLGCLGLIGFLVLTGFHPTVLKAVLMGFAALIGMGLKRKVKRLGALLLIAVLMLLFNPLWIWDLGFELSFLATLGLIVTVPPLIKRLDWLPPAIASLIAVPLAATIWTLPLQLHLFSVVPLYCLPIGILASPLISIVVIGGMLSALVSLVSPNLGSSIASFLYYPTHLLINLVEFCSNLPGASVAVRSISTAQMLAIYTLIFLVWLIPWWQKRWLFTALIAVSLVLVPAWHSVSTLSQITVLAAGGEPVLVIQDQGKVTLINSGNEGTGSNTIIPFLQQQGVNQIDWAIATDFQGNGSNSWLEVLQRLPIKVFYNYSVTPEITGITKEVLKHKGVYQSLSVGQPVNTGAVGGQLIDAQLPILQMQILGQNWLLLGNLEPDKLRELAKTRGLPHAQILWCPGQFLQELVVALQPEVANGGYLGTQRRRRTWLPTKSFGELEASNEPKISEWGNPEYSLLNI